MYVIYIKSSGLSHNLSRVQVVIGITLLSHKCNNNTVSDGNGTRLDHGCHVLSLRREIPRMVEQNKLNVILSSLIR